MKTIVVAYDHVRTIGRDGGLPWQGQLPSDLRHFKEVTHHTSVIMGRKTFESLPDVFRPLPQRENIVVSLSATAMKGVKIARSIEEAYDMASFEPMVIGGGEIYTLALPTVDRVIATEILARTENGDTFFPELPSSEWAVASREFQPADERNRYSHTFVTYLRRNPTLLGSELGFKVNS